MNGPVATKAALRYDCTKFRCLRMVGNNVEKIA